MNDKTEKIIDTAANVAGEVAEQVGEAEQVIRSFNRAKVQFYLLGMVVGGLTGAVVAFKIAYVKAETKYSKIADEEIEEMRKHYQEKRQALEGEVAKRPLEEIVKEQGYSDDPESEPPPMAIQPPEVVLEEAEDETPSEKTTERKEFAPTKEEREIFRERMRDTRRIDREWDYQEERRKRSPDIPYIIHVDEKYEIEGYQDVTLTYYEGDDVLANERDEVMNPDDRDNLIGRNTLDQFGHGSNDTNIVYVRNDKLELIFEICKSPNSYAQVVHGFSHDDLYHGNLERMRARERDDPED